MIEIAFEGTVRFDDSEAFRRSGDGVLRVAGEYRVDLSSGAILHLVF